MKFTGIGHFADLDKMDLSTLTTELTEEEKASHCAYEFANSRAVMLSWYNDHKDD